MGGSTGKSENEGEGSWTSGQNEGRDDRKCSVLFSQAQRDGLRGGSKNVRSRAVSDTGLIVGGLLLYVGRRRFVVGGGRRLRRSKRGGLSSREMGEVFGNAEHAGRERAAADGGVSANLRVDDPGDAVLFVAWRAADAVAENVFDVHGALLERPLRELMKLCVGPKGELLAFELDRDRGLAMRRHGGACRVRRGRRAVALG
eukprot:CAMPEP_0197395372 /NCGR_PEP_ID=MMETSP1165-20131217/6891_2 /TAXON_ID=284809 /ORGANISM="Chrysocystis fragilis, Strain CCMP3189" /LENGTH=200 /DNA_ID=CAMNT_0042921131 /DNA_START=106 /DNA_END=704 /DNA_ORIENTATION=-